jgi:transcriptional regulator with XRE-family HTH domain
MDGRQLGRTVRAVRIRRGLRQRDVAERAGVHQTTVSLIEAGHAGQLRLRTIERICAPLDIRVDLVPRWRGADLHRLLDEAHALLVERAAAELTARGWQTEIEYTFNHYGERGSVDIIAWRQDRLALLIVEVKTRLVDLQELLSTLDRKVRIVPGLLARERGWTARSVGRVLVVAETAGNRLLARRHGATFVSTLPARNVEVRRWLGEPVGGLAGVWFLHDKRAPLAMRERVANQRIRAASRRDR